MFLCASVLLIIAFILEMHSHHCFDISKNMKQAARGLESGPTWFPGSAYRLQFNEELSVTLRESQTALIVEPTWYLGQADLAACDNTVLDVLRANGIIPTGFSPSCGNGKYSETPDQIFDLHSGAYVNVRNMTEVSDREVGYMSVVLGVAIMYTPSVDLLSVLMIRFENSDVESPRTVVFSSTVSENESTLPLKVIALILLSFQILLDIFYLIATKDFRPPRSVLGYCKSMDTSFGSVIGNHLNFAASSGLLIYLALDFSSHRSSFLETLVPLSWFNFTNLTENSLNQVDFTSHVLNWIAGRSDLHVFKVHVTALAIARSALLMSSHPRLAVLVSTLKRGLNEIVASLTILLLVYCLFGFMAFYLFADSMLSMSSFGRVLFTQLLMLMNQWPFADLFRSDNLAAAFMYIIFFGFFMYLIVLNTYLGVVLSAFDSAKTSLHNSKVERSIFADAYLIGAELFFGTLHSWPCRRNLIEILEKHKADISPKSFIKIMTNVTESTAAACSRICAFYTVNFPEIQIIEETGKCDDSQLSGDSTSCTLTKLTKFKNTLRLLSKSLTAEKH